MKKLDIKIKDTSGADIQVQIREYLSSEDYYKYMILAPKTDKIEMKDIDEKLAKQQQDTEYHLILSTVINPKLTEEMIRKMPFQVVNKLRDLIAAEVFPSQEEEEAGETDFLGQGEQPEDLPLEPKEE